MSVNHPHLYLASASPRRQQLLHQVGISYQLTPVQLDESLKENEAADDYVLRLAEAKAKACFHQLSAAEMSAAVVLGADTTVVCNKQILGKPQNQQQAVTMLELLSGKQHQVMTAVTVMSSQKTSSILSVTDVSFRVLTKQDIASYWQSGEPVDKAGSYAIQGLAAQFVSEIRGSYSGVVGLPLMESVELLKRFGVESCYRDLND